jgi:hypothetical protein
MTGIRFLSIASYNSISADHVIMTFWLPFWIKHKLWPTYQPNFSPSTKNWSLCIALHCTAVHITQGNAACCQHFVTVYWAWTELLSACATAFLDAFSSTSYGEQRYRVFELRDIFSFLIRCKALPLTISQKRFYLLSKFNLIFTKSKFCLKWEFFCFAHSFFYVQHTFRNYRVFFSHVKFLRMSKLFPPRLSASAKCWSMADICQLVFCSWKYSIHTNDEFLVTFFIADLKLL